MEKVSKLLIDAALKVGDQLHTALTSALGNVGQRLSFQELQTAIQQIEISQCLTFPDDVVTGDLFSKASFFYLSHWKKAYAVLSCPMPTVYFEFLSTL